MRRLTTVDSVRFLILPLIFAFRFLSECLAVNHQLDPSTGWCLQGLRVHFESPIPFILVPSWNFQRGLVQLQSQSSAWLHLAFKKLMQGKCLQHCNLFSRQAMHLRSSLSHCCHCKRLYSSLRQDGTAKVLCCPQWQRSYRSYSSYKRTLACAASRQFDVDEALRGRRLIQVTTRHHQSPSCTQLRKQLLLVPAVSALVMTEMAVKVCTFNGPNYGLLTLCNP